jgi:hypothetical protein
MTEASKLRDDLIQAMTEALTHSKGEGLTIPPRLITKDSDLGKCACP